MDPSDSKQIYERDKIQRSSQRLSSKNLIGQPLQNINLSANRSSVSSSINNPQDQQRVPYQTYQAQDNQVKVNEEPQRLRDYREEYQYDKEQYDLVEDYMKDGKRVIRLKRKQSQNIGYLTQNIAFQQENAQPQTLMSRTQDFSSQRVVNNIEMVPGERVYQQTFLPGGERQRVYSVRAGNQVYQTNGSN